MEKRVIYYSDELNDEFSEMQLEPKLIDGNYEYLNNSFWKKITHFFWYRIIATPIVWIYLKLKFRHKIVGKKILKGIKKDAYFMYGNHTHHLADVGIPSMVSYPKHTYIIVNPANLSIPVIGKLTPSLGAIPLPKDKDATRNFISCIEKRVKEKRCIMIYPEAHIWPFYTKIRPFVATSFRYPVEHNKPVVCFTNVYTKRKYSKNPKITTYIDGPFYPDKTKSNKAQREELRNLVYEAMGKRSELNNVEIITYIKKEGKVND